MSKKLRKTVAAQLIGKPPILTLEDLRAEINSVYGIRSCKIKTEIGQAKVSIKYSWWTNLWFGLKKKTRKRVVDLVYNRIPIGVGFSMGSKVIKL